MPYASRAAYNAYRRQWLKDERALLKANRSCTDCGKTADEGFLTCGGCRKIAAEKSKRFRAVRSAARLTGSYPVNEGSSPSLRTTS